MRGRAAPARPRRCKPVGTIIVNDSFEGKAWRPWRDSMSLTIHPTSRLRRWRITRVLRAVASLRPGPFWPSILLAGLLVARMSRKMPLLPEPTGDSPAYLAQAAYRPPLYGAVLQAWQGMVGGLEYLPLAQLLLLGAALCYFGIELGRLLRRWWVGPVAILVTLLHTAVHDSPTWLLTEAVYLAVILLGLALLCRHARRHHLALLLGAAACFGLATLARSTGLVFVVLPLLLALFDRRQRPWPALRHTVAAGLVVLGVLGAGMTATWHRHGHFELGSWSGISLLGKALMLAQPEDAAVLPPPVAAVLPVVQQERRLLAAQPDLAARLRAQVQASGDVRFAAFWDAADAGWPAWQAADDRGKGHLALALDRQLIAAHPWEYLNLWAHDWLSLVIHPAYWPAWATTEAAEPNAFPLCGATGNCWALQRFDLPMSGYLPLFAVSILGTALALALLAWLTPRVLRRRAGPATVLAWSLALVVHASLLGSSAFEYGMVRYTIALHVLDLTLLLWLAVQYRGGREAGIAR